LWYILREAQALVDDKQDFLDLLYLSLVNTHELSVIKVKLREIKIFIFQILVEKSLDIRTAAKKI